MHLQCTSTKIWQPSVRVLSSLPRSDCKDVDIRLLAFTSYKLRKMFSVKNPIPNGLRVSQVVDSMSSELHCVVFLKCLVA